MTWGPIGGGGGGTSSATYTVTDALVIGAATTSGIRLDLGASNELEVREGDDSAYAPLNAGTILTNTALIVGAATTSGVRLDLESGILAVREGDDSGYVTARAFGFDSTPSAANEGVSINYHKAGASFGASAPIVWTSAAPSGTADTGLARSSAGVVAIKEVTNNSATNIHQITASSGALSGASYSFTNALPAGAIILGVTVRVTTTITGATTFDVGDGTDVDRYGAAIALASGTTTTFASATASPLEWRSANGNVVLTANGSNFTGGVVRICVHYLTGTAPTS